MKHLATKLFALIITAILPNILQANTINLVLPNSSSLKWFDASNLPPGAKLAILAGDPKRKEFYVARLKLPANFIIPAHSHLTNEYNTIISGAYYMGIGDSMDKNHTITLPAGSFITFPAGTMYYGFTKEETILEISGIGPWGTIPKKLENKQF